MSFNLLVIILFSLILVLFITGFFVLFVYISKRTKTIGNQQKKQNNIEDQINFEKTNINNNRDFKNKVNELNKREKLLLKQQNNLEALQKLYKKKIDNLSSNDKEIIKKELINNLKEIEKQYVNDIIEQTTIAADQKAASILLQAMETVVMPLIQEHTTTSLKINDEQIKGRLIGKDGRNKRAFEMVTGTDLIIEKDSNFVTISSHNSIRREIAKLLLNELIKLKAIEPTRIESLYNEVKKDFETELFEIGKDVVENKLNINDLNKEIYPYIGRLKFRSSLGQNALTHSIECASLAGCIAKELNLDIMIAIKTALLHDIGKSIDFDFNNNHIDAGVMIAKKYGLDEKIVNAIQSHHGQIKCSNIYSEITKLTDTISAARPGARVNSYNEYFTRVQELENIVKTFPEVSNAYVVKAGRTVRIMVNPVLVDDVSLIGLSNQIKDKIESNPIVKGYNIKVILIKENRIEFETKSKQ